MRITETFRRAGGGTFSIPGAPNSVVEEVVAGGVGWTEDTSSYNAVDSHIFVTEHWHPVADVDWSDAQYVGRLVDQTDDYTFEFAGMATWWGAEGYPCDIYDGTHSGGPSDLETWVDVLVTNGNGITKGAVFEPGGTYTGEWVRTSPIEMLDKICDSMGADWLFSFGSIVVGPTADLFETDPADIITPSAAPAGRLEVGLTHFPGRFVNKKRTVRELTNTVYTVGDGEGAAATVDTATSGSTIAYGWLGSAVTLARNVDAPNENATNAGAIGDATLALFETPRFEFSALIEAGTRMLPGNAVFVYSQEQGILDASADGTDFRGEVITPLTQRIQQCAWSPPEGSGLYLLRDAGTPVYTDLTEWAAFVEEDTQLDFGSGQAAGDQAVASGQGRFNPPLYERLTR